MTRRNIEKNIDQNHYPKLINDKDSIKVIGYQHYSIDKTKVFNATKKLKQKAKNVELILKKYKPTCTTLVDFGCSQGYYSFYSHFLGYENIVGIDHDVEYIKQDIEISNKLELPLEFISDKFGNYTKPKDVVLFLALIHWVYNCTGKIGSLKKIIDYLYSITNKVLVIEWIDTKDSAIKSYNHISYDKSVITEEYSKENFEKAIGVFSNIQILDSNSETRKLYICEK